MPYPLTVKCLSEEPFITRVVTENKSRLGTYIRTTVTGVCAPQNKRRKLEQTPDNECFALLLGLLQKDNIGIAVAPHNAKTPAIWGPVERKDLLLVEVGDLTPGRTVNWLNPDVVTPFSRIREV